MNFSASDERILLGNLQLSRTGNDSVEVGAEEEPWFVGGLVRVATIAVNIPFNASQGGFHLSPDVIFRAMTDQGVQPSAFRHISIPDPASRQHCEVLTIYQGRHLRC